MLTGPLRTCPPCRVRTAKAKWRGEEEGTVVSPSLHKRITKSGPPGSVCKDRASLGTGRQRPKPHSWEEGSLEDPPPHSKICLSREKGKAMGWGEAGGRNNGMS